MRKVSRKTMLLIVVTMALAIAGALAYLLVVRPSSAATECGSDRRCFYEAYQNGCPASTIHQEVRTVEGDPLYLDAVLARNNNVCQVAVKIDASASAFASAPVEDFTCQQLSFIDGTPPKLQAENCSGSSSQREYIPL